MHDVNTHGGTDGSSSPKTILIVEDDTGIGEFLVAALKDETPYQVTWVQDGFAALKLVRSLIPQLIILDYQLPGMDGLECVDQLRKTAGGEHVPILFMSAAFPKQANERDGLTLLRKPFELETLLLHVEQTLGDQ